MAMKMQINSMAMKERILFMVGAEMITLRAGLIMMRSLEIQATT